MTDINRSASAGSVAQALIVSGALSVTSEGEPAFKYKSGLRSPFYLNCRALPGHPGAFHAVTVAFAKELREKRDSFDIIAGVPNGAIPYSAVVAVLLRVPHLWILKSGPKGHGKDDPYSGADPRGKRVHFIEDVFTSGSSVTDTIKLLEPLGGMAVGASGIFSSNPEKVRANLMEAHGIATDIMLDLPSLVYQLSATGRLTDEDAARIADWHQDPKAWSEKYLKDHPE